MVKFGIELAKRALKIQAIKINPERPFQWASGYFMPIYNDNRMLLYDPSTRKLIAEGFSQIIKRKKIKFDVVAGTSTAGIPHAETLADLLEKPMIYIRDKPKDHGLRNQIEGIDSNKNLFGLEAIVVEDLVSTGGSSLKAVHAVRNARGKVRFMFSIFNYGFPEIEQEFREEEVKYRVEEIASHIAPYVLTVTGTVDCEDHWTKALFVKVLMGSWGSLVSLQVWDLSSPVQIRLTPFHK